MKVTKESVKEAVNLTEKEMEEVLQDILPIIEEMEDLPSKSERNIAVVYEDTKTLFELVKDTYNGAYKPQDTFALVTATLSLIYLVCPIDAIPDLIPGVGYIDDAAVLAYAIGVCAMEIKKYREFKENQAVSVIDSDPYTSARAAVQ